MAPRSTLLAFALLAETCVADISLNCKIFDETMVCDNERSRLHRAEADRYADLKVNYINHHNPDLVLFDEAGEEVQRIDLTRIRTLANIHKLLGLLGMKENCRDLNPSCGEWQRAGQCSANPQFMLMNCRLSCGECSEKASSGSAVLCTNSSPESDCDYWAAIGECASNPTFMHASCKRSCGLCVLDRSDEDDDDSGKDEL